MTQEEIDGWDARTFNLAVYRAFEEMGGELRKMLPDYLRNAADSDSLVEIAIQQEWDYFEQSHLGAAAKYETTFTIGEQEHPIGDDYFVWGTDRRRVRATAFLLAHHAQKASTK